MENTNNKSSSKEPKLPFGVDNVHLIRPDKGFIQVIYKREFKPKTLEVHFKYDPQIPNAGRECKNVSFLIKIYGHDTKSKGKRVSNEIEIPFFETKRIWCFAENHRKGQLVDKYIQFKCEEYCPYGISENEKEEFFKQQTDSVTHMFAESTEPIRLSTIFPFDENKMEEKKEYTLHAIQLHFLPIVKGEKAKKPWIISIDRWIGMYFGMLDGEPVLLGGTEQRTEIRMTSQDFLEFTAIIQNTIRRWLYNAYIYGERIPGEPEYKF